MNIHSLTVALGKFWIVGPLALAALLQWPPLAAEPIAVRFPEGSVHGFLVIRTLEHKVLASGDLVQTVHGSRVMSRLVFHFKDGSVDDESSTFSQRGEFRLISDHHIQRGPSFKQATDVTIDASSGRVTVRYEEKGKQKVGTEQLKLPPDLANGIILNVLKNVPADSKETRVSYVAATPKARLVQLLITPAGEDSFSIAGSRHQAVRFVVKAELGGVTGMIAPLIGKQPADTQVWVLGGEVPAFVKSEGPLYVGGPIWSTELTSPVWR